MKFKDLSEKHKNEVLQYFIRAWNEIYMEEGIDIRANSTSEEVWQSIEEHDYTIKTSKYIGETVEINGL